MGEAKILPMTVEAFLAWEAVQEARYEFVAGRPQAMTGGSIAHDEVRGSIFALFRAALKVSPCRVQLDVKVVCGTGNVRYPDVLIRCGRNRPTDLVAAEPTIVVEVLSPSTQASDFLVKLVDYGSVPSISTYLIFWQDAAKATVFRRRDGRLVPSDEHLGLDAAIEMQDVGVTLKLADVYEDVDLAPADA